MVENAALTEMPSDELLEQCIDRYLEEHWEDIVADIDKLVRIPDHVGNVGVRTAAH